MTRAQLRPRTPLHDGDIHLWRVRLDGSQAEAAELAQVLSPDEHERAGRFRFDRDRVRYIVGRAFLRSVLARYTGKEATALRFTYSAHGKPSLAEGERVAFNLAHAGDTALLAVAGVELGVDLEPLHAGSDDERVAETFFAPGEVKTLRRLPAVVRPHSFLRCWTRKEAFLKATGDGLTLPLQDFEVTLSPDEQPALIWTAWSEDEPRSWRLVDVSWACPGHVAALALRRTPRRIIAHEWWRASARENNNGNRKENDNGFT